MLDENFCLHGDYQEPFFAIYFNDITQSEIEMQSRIPIEFPSYINTQDFFDFTDNPSFEYNGLFENGQLNENVSSSIGLKHRRVVSQEVPSQNFTPLTYENTSCPDASEHFISPRRSLPNINLENFASFYKNSIIPSKGTEFDLVSFNPSKENSKVISKNALNQRNSTCFSDQNLKLKCPIENFDKTSTQMHNFHARSKVHAFDRPFKCKSCHATFCRSHDLRRHERTHSGDKPFQCNQCNKNFTRQDALSRHIRLGSCPLMQYNQNENFT